MGVRHGLFSARHGLFSITRVLWGVWVYYLLSVATMSATKQKNPPSVDIDKKERPTKKARIAPKRVTNPLLGDFELDGNSFHQWIVIDDHGGPDIFLLLKSSVNKAQLDELQQQALDEPDTFGLLGDIDFEEDDEDLARLKKMPGIWCRMMPFDGPVIIETVTIVDARENALDMMIAFAGTMLGGGKK